MSAKKRSALMARIRAKNTRPELCLRKQLWRAGFRYRLHGKQLPGQPDLVLPKWNAVVFVHGCFWHAHAGCAYFQLPKARAEFWAEKLGQNRVRDAAVVTALLGDGWRVAIVWECSLRADAHDAGQRLTRWLRGKSSRLDLVPLTHSARRHRAIRADD